jgi:Gpi18-like mannosyltransferase
VSESANNSSATASPSRAVRIVRPIIAALALAFVCVAIRMPWTSKTGYTGDLLFFQRWGATAADLRTSGRGIGHIYKVQRDCNYPPLYLHVLSYLPAIDAWWYGRGDWNIPRASGVKRLAAPHRSARIRLASMAPVLKLPAVIADVAITLLVLAWVWRRSGPQRGLMAACLWALNPLAIYNSAYFGQIDAIHSLWMLAALLAAVDGRRVLAWALVALALLTKAQSIVLVPVIALLTLQPLIAAIRRADGVALRLQLRTLFLAAAAAAAVTCVVLTPFARARALKDVKQVYVGSVSDQRNARVTVMAYNLWWLTLDVPVNLVRITSDRKPVIGTIAPRTIGFALLGGITAIACCLALWGGGRRSAMLAAPLIALAFFVVATQMKSRYGFASLVLMLPLIACSYRYGLVIAVMTVTFLLNCARFAALPAGFFGLTWIFNGATRLPWAGHVVAAVNLGLLGYLFFELFRCARQERRKRRLVTVQCGA